MGLGLDHPAKIAARAAFCAKQSGMGEVTCQYDL